QAIHGRAPSRRTDHGGIGGPASFFSSTTGGPLSSFSSATIEPLSLFSSTDEPISFISSATGGLLSFISSTTGEPLSFVSSATSRLLSFFFSTIGGPLFFFFPTIGGLLSFFFSSVGGPLSFVFSANAGHFANATTHRSSKTPPGMSAINENTGLNPVRLKSFQNGTTKKTANDITQGMISDPSTWSPLIYGNPSPPGFLFTLQPGCLPAACCPTLFNKRSGLYI